MERFAAAPPLTDTAERVLLAVDTAAAVMLAEPEVNRAVMGWLGSAGPARAGPGALDALCGRWRWARERVDRGAAGSGAALLAGATRLRLSRRAVVLDCGRTPRRGARTERARHRWRLVARLHGRAAIERSWIISPRTGPTDAAARKYE